MVSLLLIAGLLCTLHWAIALCLFAATMPGIFLRLRHAGELYHWRYRRTLTERWAHYFNGLLTHTDNAKEVRLFELGPVLIRRFQDLRRQLGSEKLSLSVQRATADFLAQSIVTLVVTSTYFYIAYQAFHGAMTLGGFVMYYQAFQRGQGLLQDLTNGLAALYEDNLFLSSFYEFLDIQARVVEPAHPRTVPRPLQTGIAFEGVSFHYPQSDHHVLEDVSLTIRPGEIVALVGANGAGKTTLIKLLCRLYDPDNGRITLDGIDLRQFKTTDFRREIGVLFQDYAHYNLTAKENIWFGNINIPLDDNSLNQAARRAGADQIIDALPNGYETMLVHN